jgi:WD40 repeat protein
MRVWALPSGQVIGIDDPYSEYVGYHRTTRVAFSPDGARVIYRDVPANDDMYGTPIVIWDVAARRHDFPWSDVDPVYSPNGRYVAHLNAYGLNGLFDTRTSQEIQRSNMQCSAFNVGMNFGDSAHSTWAAFNPDSTLLAAAVWDECAPDQTDPAGYERNTIGLYDLPDGNLRHILRGNTTPPYRLLFSPDGSQLLSQNTDGRIRLWDIETGALLEEWPRE